MPPLRGPKGWGVADRQCGGCISIFEQVLTDTNVTTVTTFTAYTAVNVVIRATVVSSVTVDY